MVYKERIKSYAWVSGYMPGRGFFILVVFILVFKYGSPVFI